MNIVQDQSDLIIKEYDDFLEYRTDRDTMELEGYEYLLISTCNSRGKYVVNYMRR